MMFTVDLLKGQGRPKLKPRGTAVLVILALIIPAVVGLSFAVQYVCAGIEIPGAKLALEKNMFEEGQTQSSVKQEIDLCKSYIKEVEQVASQQVQWSGVIENIVKSLPDSLIIDGIKTSSVKYTVEVPSATDPDKKVKVAKIKKLINLRIVSKAKNLASKDIENYVKNLTDIGLNATIKNQSKSNIKNEDVTVYQVECVIDKD